MRIVVILTYMFSCYLHICEDVVLSVGNHASKFIKMQQQCNLSSRRKFYPTSYHQKLRFLMCNENGGCSIYVPNLHLSLLRVENFRIKLFGNPGTGLMHHIFSCTCLACSECVDCRFWARKGSGFKFFKHFIY